MLYPKSQQYLLSPLDGTSKSPSVLLQKYRCFFCFFIENPPRKTDDPTGRIGYRKHYSRSEAVVKLCAGIGIGTLESKSGLRYFLRLISFLRQMSKKIFPSVGNKSQSKAAHSSFFKSSCPEILFCWVILGKLRFKIFRRIVNQA